jgi:hypothetical protein
MGVEGKTAFWEPVSEVPMDTKIPNLGAYGYKIYNASSNWLWNNPAKEKYFIMNETDAEIDGDCGLDVNGSILTPRSGSWDGYFMWAFSSGAESGIDDQVHLTASESNPLLASVAKGFTADGPIDEVVSIATPVSHDDHREPRSKIHLCG